MAFPSGTRGGGNSGANVTTTTPDVNALSGIAAGDLVIISIVKDGTGGFTWPGSPAYTNLCNGIFEATNQQGFVSVRARIYQAGDSNPAITHASEGTAWRIWRIAKGTYFGASVGESIEASAGSPTTGDSTNPDPPTNTPSWGALDTLFIAVAGNDGNVAITAGPTNYTDGAMVNSRWANTGGAGVADAGRNLNATSDNPGTFTMNTEQWAALTLAVRPCAQVAGNTISSGAALTVPTLRYKIAAAFLASTLALSAPTVIADQSIAGEHIASTAALNAPAVKHVISGAHVASTAALTVPTVRYVVAGAHRASTVALTVPTLAHRVAGATVASTAQTFGPTVAYVISLPMIGEVHNGLFAMWRLEEASGSRADSVGTNTLTDNNTVTQATGKVGDAAQFVHANSEFLQIATPSTAMELDASFAFSVWVYVDSLPGPSDIHVIVDRNRNYDIDLLNSGAAFRLYYLDSGSVTRQVRANSFGTPALATWIHIYADYNSITQQSRICINNGVVESATHPNPPDHALAGNFRVGDRGGVREWDGRIDAFHIWKRLLTVAERDYLYNSGSGREVYSGTSTAVLGTSTTFPPATTYVVNGSTIAAGSALFEPTVSQGGGAQAVSAAHIASTVVLSAPILAYRVNGATIASTAATFAPTLRHVVAGAHISSTVILSAPTLRYRVNLATIASTLVLFGPSLSQEGTVGVAHIPSTLALFGPTISAGAITVNGAHIASTVALNAPTVRYRIAGATISSTAQVNVPTLRYVVLAPHLASTLSLFAPTLTAVSGVSGQHISSTLTLFAPTLVQGDPLISVAHIASTLVLFPPTITGGAPILVAPGGKTYTRAEDRTTHVGVEGRTVYGKAEDRTTKVAG